MNQESKEIIEIQQSFVRIETENYRVNINLLDNVFDFAGIFYASCDFRKHIPIIFDAFKRTITNQNKVIINIKSSGYFSKHFLGLWNEMFKNLNNNKEIAHHILIECITEDKEEDYEICICNLKEHLADLYENLNIEFRANLI